MKIVVTSDTHGQKDILNKIVEKNSDAELFLYAGDSQISFSDIFPFKSVKGNCDRGVEYPIEMILNTPYGDIFITHGHKYCLITNQLVKSKNCKIFIYGHTHKHVLKEIDGTYVCNPGSPVLPRDKTKGTYLIIKMDENKIDFEFKYL